MAIRKIEIPRRFAEEMHRQAAAHNLSIGAWEPVAVSMHHVATSLRKKLDDEHDPADKAYLAHELILGGVESAEMAGSAYLSFRSNKPRRFHHATNEELATAFAQLINEIATEDALEFLGLRVRSEVPTDVKALIGSVGKKAARCLQGLAEYWSSNVSLARRFRHYPAWLHEHEPVLIDPSSDAAISEGVAGLRGSVADVIEIVALPDERTFSFEPISLTSARLGQAVTAVAIQLMYMWSGNKILDASSERPEDRLPKVYPALSAHLTSDEVAVLSRWGGYCLVS